MTIDINQFWNLLSGSKLVTPEQHRTLFTHFASEFNRSTDFGDGATSKDSNESNSFAAGNSAESVAHWLVKQKAISQYQAKILLAGENGPFHYGSYTVTDRIRSGPLAGSFRGIHRRTQHPVLLQFVPGTSQDDLQRWRTTESQLNKIARMDHPNLVQIHEPVALQNFRFVVSELTPGKTLARTLPRKGRMPWADACQIMGGIADAVGQLHKSDLQHLAISPRTIWFNNKRQAALRMPLQPDPDYDQPDPSEKASECKYDYLAPETFAAEPVSDARSDVYSIGCVLFRLIAGRPPFPDTDVAKKKELHRTASIPSLEKYKLPEELESLMKKMLAKNPEQRPTSASEIGQQLFKLSGTSLGESGPGQDSKSDSTGTTDENASTLKAYLGTIQNWTPGGKTESPPTPEIESEQVRFTRPDTPLTAQERIQHASTLAEKRKKGGWKVPAIITASLLALSAVIGATVMNLSAPKIAFNSETGNTPGEEHVVIGTTDPNSDNNSNLDPSGPDRGNSADTNIANGNSNSDTSNDIPGLVQDLIDDDGQTLWETPTEGAPLSLTHLPAGPRMIFVFRPSELLGTDQGDALLKSLGPRFGLLATQWQQRSGLGLDQVQQLVVALYPTDQFDYRPSFFVRLAQPITESNLLKRWGDPQIKNLPNLASNSDTSARAYTGSNTAFYIPEGVSNEVDRFAMGTVDQIDEVHENQGGLALTGSLNRIVERTDRQRHFNMIFLRNSLFNDEGQRLMASMKVLNDEMKTVLDDEIRGGLVSMHIDDGTYLELLLDQDRELKTADLRNRIEEKLPRVIQQLTRYTASNPANDHWKNVHIRYAAMLGDLFKNTRTNVEGPNVVSNCWLPPVAAHNLIAASEMLISFAGTGGGAVVSAGPKAPQTIEALLNSTRNIKNTTNPDLVVLLAEIQEEIRGDFPTLPFEFNIRLKGPELGKAGITQNQRPGTFEFSDKRISEILTEIMVRANPNKDITGASDLNCKLIWVIADDPKQPGQKAVVVTSRADATAQNYELPAPFQEN